MAAGTLADLRNGYDMGGGGVEGKGGLPIPREPMVDPAVPAMKTEQSPWAMPSAAFAPGASQNAPRLFQDPSTGGWTLSEHGHFRSDPDLQANIGAHQQRVTDYWNQYPTGFIQPGQTNYDPAQALSNEGYGQPANWQSLWTNAGQQVPGMTPSLMGTAQPGTLAELSNPERVAAMSQSSYSPLLVR